MPKGYLAYVNTTHDQTAVCDEQGWEHVRSKHRSSVQRTTAIPPEPRPAILSWPQEYSALLDVACHVANQICLVSDHSVDNIQSKNGVMIVGLLEAVLLYGLYVFSLCCQASIKREVNFPFIGQICFLQFWQKYIDVIRG